MKLSTKSRYAVQAMVDLAKNSSDKPCNLNEISIRQNISLSYLEQIFNKLKKSNLVFSIKGPGGGYNLSKAPNKIKISEIIMELRKILKQQDVAMTLQSFVLEKTKNVLLITF